LEEGKRWGRLASSHQYGNAPPWRREEVPYPERKEKKNSALIYHMRNVSIK